MISIASLLNEEVVTKAEAVHYSPYPYPKSKPRTSSIENLLHASDLIATQPQRLAPINTNLNSFRTDYFSDGTNSPVSPNGNRPFPCNRCDQTFSRKHDLIRHERIHTGVKPFQCTRCGKGFVRKDALKRHEAMDVEIRRFRCVV